jgi:hypothetical protein
MHTKLILWDMHFEKDLFDLELAIYIIETKSGRKIQKLAVHVCAMCGHFYDLLCLTLTQQMGSTCPCTWLHPLGLLQRRDWLRADQRDWPAASAPSRLQKPPEGIRIVYKFALFDGQTRILCSSRHLT